VRAFAYIVSLRELVPLNLFMLTQLPLRTAALGRKRSPATAYLARPLDLAARRCGRWLVQIRVHKELRPCHGKRGAEAGLGDLVEVDTR
jgi:hypothetical protein